MSYFCSVHSWIKNYLHWVHDSDEVSAKDSDDNLLLKFLSLQTKLENV